MKQTQLNPKFQRAVREQLKWMYPDQVRLTAPLFIALPCGIHPYNRASGYYDHCGNAIVAYQLLGREALAGDLDIDFIRHELAHWHQFRVQGYTQVSTVNAHRHSTWGTACYLASLRLWPKAGLERWMFSPRTSCRVDGSVKVIQKKGALSDRELHHWPRSMPGYLEKLR